jgi:hypothetical protein
VGLNVNGGAPPPSGWSPVCPCGCGNFLYDGKSPAHGPGRENAALKGKSGVCLAPTKPRLCPGHKLPGGHEGCNHVLFAHGTKACEIEGVGVQRCHCEAVAVELLKLHSGNVMPWQQCDPRRWLVAGGHWEIAKLFCSKLDGRPIDPDSNAPIEYCAGKVEAVHFAGDVLFNMARMCKAFNGALSSAGAPIFACAGGVVEIDTSRWAKAGDARNHVSGCARSAAATQTLLDAPLLTPLCCCGAVHRAHHVRRRYGPRRDGIHWVRHGMHGAAARPCVWTVRPRR